MASTTRGSRGRRQGRPTAATEEAVEERREQAENAGGLKGLIARRGGQWSVEVEDGLLRRTQRPLWNFAMDHYFRMEVEGWHRLPDPPAMLIGIHASGLLPIDAYLTGFQWDRRFGTERPLHGTSHDMLMALPGVGDYLRKLGGLPAAPDSITAAFAAGHDVIIWPGGDLDALRPWRERDRVVLGGRHGFVKQAIRSAVPIVPVATIGGSDTLIQLADGKAIAKRLRLDKLMRANAFPIALGFPLGLAPGIVPQIPLPAKIRTEFLDPIELDTDPERAEDERYVAIKYREVERKLQAGVDALAKRRSFPVLG